MSQRALLVNWSRIASVAIVSLLTSGPVYGKSRTRSSVRNAMTFAQGKVKSWTNGLKQRVFFRQTRMRQDVARFMGSTPVLRQTRDYLQSNKKAMRIVRLDDKALKALGVSRFNGRRLFLYLDHDNTFKVAGNRFFFTERVARELNTPRKLRNVMKLNLEQALSLVKRAAPGSRAETNSLAELQTNTLPARGALAPGSAKLRKRGRFVDVGGQPMRASPLSDFAGSW